MADREEKPIEADEETEEIEEVVEAEVAEEKPKEKKETKKPPKKPGKGRAREVPREPVKEEGEEKKEERLSKKEKREKERKEKEAREREEEFVEEHLYTIPLRRFLITPPKLKAKRAVKAVRNYIQRHLKPKGVVISEEVNRLLWSKGPEKPPPRIKVKALTDKEGVILVRLAEGD